MSAARAGSSERDIEAPVGEGGDGDSKGGGGEGDQNGRPLSWCGGEGGASAIN